MKSRKAVINSNEGGKETRMKKLILALCLFATPALALAQGYYNDSQGEGSYNGSAGGTGNYDGMQNSHGAALLTWLRIRLSQTKTPRILP